MRISDWSSDVCSSDLGYTDDALDRPIIGIVDTASGYNACHRNVPDLIEAASRGVMLAGGIPVPFPVISIQESFTNPTSIDRKSDVEGKGVSVRVELGGPRILKKKTNHTK